MAPKSLNRFLDINPMYLFCRCHSLPFNNISQPIYLQSTLPLQREVANQEDGRRNSPSPKEANLNFPQIFIPSHQIGIPSHLIVRIDCIDFLSSPSYQIMNMLDVRLIGIYILSRVTQMKFVQLLA